MSSKIDAQRQPAPFRFEDGGNFTPGTVDLPFTGENEVNFLTLTSGQSANEIFALRTGLDITSLAQLRFGVTSADAVRPRPVTSPLTSKQMPRGLPESQYDGAFVGSRERAYRSSAVTLNEIPPVMPARGVTNNERILYVNGINTNLAGQASDMQEIANTFGSPVVGIHNATNGSVRDLLQCLDDKANVGNNLAVNSLATTVMTELKAGRGRNLHIVAHSQGGLITARALYRVYHQLVREHRARGMSRADAERATERLLAGIKVETFGAASGSYPNGPRYVHYLNHGDLVPMRYGLGPDALDNRRAGAGATVRTFKVTHPSWNPNTKFFSPHSITEVYLKFRVPFEQARREGSSFMTEPTLPLTRRGLVLHDHE